MDYVLDFGSIYLTIYVPSIFKYIIALVGMYIYKVNECIINFQSEEIRSIKKKRESGKGIENEEKVKFYVLSY